MIAGFATILSFTLSFVLGGLFIFRLIVLARKKRMFDANGDRNAHEGAVPRLAGMSLFPTIFFTVIAVLLFCNYLAVVEMDEFSTYYWNRLLSFLLGFGVLFLVGLHDDLFGMSYKSKFIAQFFVALIIVINGLYFDNLCGFLGINEIPAWLGMLITSIIIVAVINAFNLFDGIDGLCAGLSLGILGIVQLWLVLKEASLFAIINAAVMGTVAAYLFFNMSKGRLKIFMGDTGSLSLGFIVTFMLLTICSHNRMFYGSTGETELVILGLVFFPLFDMARVFSVRILRGKSPFLPDKNHLHHKVLAVVGTHLRTTVTILTFAAVLAVVNYLFRKFNVHLVVLFDFIYALLVNQLFNYLQNK